MIYDFISAWAVAYATLLKETQCGGCVCDVSEEGHCSVSLQDQIDVPPRHMWDRTLQTWEAGSGLLCMTGLAEHWPATSKLDFFRIFGLWLE